MFCNYVFRNATIEANTDNYLLCNSLKVFIIAFTIHFLLKPIKVLILIKRLYVTEIFSLDIVDRIFRFGSLIMTNRTVPIKYNVAVIRKAAQKP